MSRRFQLQFARILRRFGGDVHHDVRRLESLLRDRWPDRAREVAVLVEAAASGTLAELLEIEPGQPRERALHRMAQRLRDSSGIELRHAHWSLQTWARALAACGHESSHVADAETHEPSDETRQDGSVVRCRVGSFEAVLGP